MAPLVRPHFHTVAFDLRGHGQSGDGPWSLEQAVADIEAVATQLSWGTPDAVGHSLGEMLAVCGRKSTLEPRPSTSAKSVGRSR